MAKLSVDQSLLRAKGLARKGQIEEARKLCQEVIDAFPNNKRARAALARLSAPSHDAPGQSPPQKKLERLGALLSEGKPEVAAAEAERLSKSFPNSLIVWNLLGAASAEAGQNEKAEKAFRHAVTLSPNHAEAHRNLGKVLINAGKFEEAIEACRRALRVRPDYLEGFNTLGNALKASRRYEEAAATYLRALKIQPNYVEVLCNLGNTLLEMGKGDKAVQVYEKAVKLEPGLYQASHGLGLALLSQGRTGDAISICKEAIAGNPEHAAAHLLLGNTLRQDGQFDEALSAVNTALNFAPSDAEAHNDLGITFQAQDRLDSAIDAFGQALEIRPEYAQARKNLGVAQLAKGSAREAAQAYETVLLLNPGDAEAHRHLSSIKTFDFGDPQIAEMTALLSMEKLADTDRCQLYFALAKVSDDLGDHEQSFAYLREGNTLRKAMLGYDASEDETQFASLKAVSGDLRAAALTLHPEKDGVTPVFILGMPRSGTTLVEQIVSAHSEVTGAGELSLVERLGATLATGEAQATADNLRRFRDAYMDGIGRLAQGRRLVTDKMPMNFRYVPLICAALPEAKIIHVERDPKATCWSNYRQYFENRSLGFCYDLADTVAYYRLYDDLMRIWTSEYGNKLLNFGYEALTENQEHLSRELIAYLGLEWQDACLSPQENARAVTTASQQQVRNAVYRGSSEAWRRYEPFLGDAFKTLDS